MGTKTLLMLVLVFVLLLKGGSAVETLTSCRDCWCLDACNVIVEEKSSKCRAFCFHKNKHPEIHIDEYVDDDLFDDDWSDQVETIPHLIFYRDKDIESLAIGIDCTHFDIGDMSTLNTTVNDLIPKLDDLNNEIGSMTKLTLKYCPFLDQSFVRTLNMTSVKQLKVIGSPDDIRLCSNYFDEHFRSVKFISFQLNNGLKSLDEDVFKGTPHLIDLELKSNQITSLDPGVFQHLTKLQSLDLSYNKIADLKPNIFQGLPSLYNLNIKNNQLVNLTSGLFSNILNLRTLDISCNNISALHSGVFYGNFTHLYLRENKISTVNPDVFRHLGNLKKLDLSHNRITDLEPNIFQGLTSLETLGISNNQLVSLAQGLFQNCQKLEVLDLDENELNYLGETPFDLLRNLKVLYLKGNQLEKITDGMFNGTHDIVLLDLSHNKLNVISQTAFDILCRTNSELDAIYLSDNILEWNSNLVDSPFNECESITVLQLSNNRISYIHDDWIRRMPKLAYVFLEGNNITQLHDYDYYASLSKTMTLDVSYNQIKTAGLDSINHAADNVNEGEGNKIELILIGNPITCDCSNYDLFYFVQNVNKGVSKRLDIVYSEKSDDILKCKPWNISIDTFDLKTLTCTNVDGCPSSCNCSHSPYHSQTTVNCSSANLERMPQELDVMYKNKTPQTIMLILRNNSIQQILQNPPDNYKLVTDLDLSLNKIKDWKVDIVQDFPHLASLNLSHNHLESLSEDFINSLSYSNISSLSLSGNPWTCGCDDTTERMYTFLLTEEHILKDLKQITCNGSTQPLNTIRKTDFCSTSTVNQHLMVGIIILGSLGILFGLLVIMYYKYQNEIKVWLFTHEMLWLLTLCWVTQEDIDSDKVYDAFLSYTEQDYGFVVHTLLPELEKSFKICHHARDFIGGEWIADQIYQKVHQSRRTIIVLTEEFLNSIYGIHEFRTAHAQSIADNRARVIILILGDMPPQEAMPDEMKAYMSMNTYLKWGDKWFWDKLKYALPHPPPRPIHECPMVERSRILMNPSSSVGDNN